MRLVNAFCRLVEVAAEQHAGVTVPVTMGLAHPVAIVPGTGEPGSVAALASSDGHRPEGHRATDPPPSLVLFPELDTRPSRR